MKQKIAWCCWITIQFFSVYGQDISKSQLIENTYLNECAFKFHYLQQGWDDCISQGLQEDPTNASLWQMKALPLWKTGKYELALACYDNAVKYNRKLYLSRRGFLKCIFQKNYKDALLDLEQAEKEFGYTYENDHSLQFYQALCYLQLGGFLKANQILKTDINKSIKNFSEDSVSSTEYFYLGISEYELRNFDEALLAFDKAIEISNRFSDAKFYKGLCFLELKQIEKAEKIMYEAKLDFENGFSIEENDAKYERYPYQVNWNMSKWIIPNYSE